MNIGIDIDGVITNLDFIKMGNKEKHTILDTNPAMKYQNNKLIREVLYHGIKLYSKHAKVRNDASKIINSLKNDGDKIHIITRRQFASEDSKKGNKIRTLVELHLINHDIPYDSITFTNGDKIKECLEEKIDVMIEDNPITAMKLTSYIPVIVFDTPYNFFLSGNNIYHAKSWEDVYEIISQYFRKQYQFRKE
jgi:uncharacterized HAD superfamily protein